MVQLPTLDVSQAQVDRLLAVFAGPNGTQAEAVANYRAWLKDSLVNYVLQQEQLKMRIAQDIELRGIGAKIAQDFPGLTDGTSPVVTDAVPKAAKSTN